MVDAIGPDARIVSMHDSPHALTEAFHLLSECKRKMMEYTIFDLLLFKRYVLRTV